MKKINEWFNKYRDHIVFYGYLAVCAVGVLLVIFYIIGGIYSFFTTLTADIPAWLKWQLLTR